MPAAGGTTARAELTALEQIALPRAITSFLVGLLLPQAVAVTPIRQAANVAAIRREWSLA